MRDYDLLLICAIGTLLVFGLIMVFSSSIALGDGPKFVNADRYYFFKRHFLFLAAGIVICMLVTQISMPFWEKYALHLYVLAVITLIAVFIIGVKVNGAYRWISLGPIRFQPSELAKLVMIIFTSWYTARKKQYMKEMRGFAPIIVFAGIICGLLFIEPDLGATIVVVAIVFGLIFLGGVSLKVFVGLVILAIAGVVFAIILEPFRVQRFFAYLDPFSEQYAQSTAYQLTHSLIAVGRGEIFGVGLGFSIEKLHYLPEAHTDFIMAVVAEELGFVGILGVIVLFSIIIKKGLEIGRQSIAMDREFNGLVAQGVAIWFGVQTFINLGVCFGLLPTKGLTLPFVSYGGSALVMNLVAVGLLLRVDYENRCMMRGQRPYERRT
ncbi:putative lipid II flippase FtsW [Pelistega sp. NLN82]|uniref:Probable peptidoglycan glycosyltransferase FtsW n=1 Tax=Pelistega ratti TaxID=2652177 RepID=A0A6L9Y5C8_9BURK|nr:putative lipid II flippase FtsW [Pelistega ratti]NEN75660.1 putative lipid II flippase FtsW [Pelistega ratti]